DLHSCEAAAAVAGGHTDRRAAAEDLTEALDAHRGSERFREHHRQRGDGDERESEEERAHQPPATRANTSSRLRVMRCVAPQITWPATGNSRTGSDRPPKSHTSSRSTPGATRSGTGTVKMVSTSRGCGLHG